ncbi:putative Smr domain-containing protein [Melia azedarach]|uniref:Smr domain-containing protein n=1 Tax=Melia azedarach TaxID=155640 RepID=A0ACC1YS39_MELAZ|nr:putative Smr domain-containing protein [Melia azedarach]
MRKQAIARAVLSDVEVRDLEGLLEAFGSQFSLEDIASAYCQAKHDINVAIDILGSMNGTTGNSAIDASKDKIEVADTAPLELASDNVLHSSYADGRNIRVLKSKNRPLSMGTVSGLIGKGYMKTKPLTNNSCEPTKPLKLDSKELPVYEIWCDEVPLEVTEKKGTMVADVEEFLFKMLGDGFQLDMAVIEEVLRCCGYEMQKSMAKLIELAASTLEKCDDVFNIPPGKSTEKCPVREPFFEQEQLIYPDSAQSDGARSVTRNLRESTKGGKDKYGLQKEVLESLFVVPERSVETPKIIRVVRPAPRSKALGKAVVDSYKDTTEENTAAELKEDAEDDGDNENSYEVLRKAVKEYWITMREYYKAAVDAFVKRNFISVIVVQGHFFSEKVREADSKSAEKIVEARNDEVLTLDWHTVEPKEAVRLLRLHLTSLAGIPTFKHFKIIVGTNDDDTTNGARKRMILKQLQKESIKWTEDGNGQVILIGVDVIDPKCFSFAKKK